MNRIASTPLGGGAPEPQGRGGTPDRGIADVATAAQIAEARRYALDEAVDGELTPELAERLRAHFGTCPECVDEVERVLAMKALVRRCCATDTAPASLRERISIEVQRVEVTITTRRGL